MTATAAEKNDYPGDEEDGDPREPAPPFFTGMPATPEDPDPDPPGLTTADLESFLRNPSRFFLQRRLQIRLVRPEDIPRDEEPLTMGFTEKRDLANLVVAICDSRRRVLEFDETLEIIRAHPACPGWRPGGTSCPWRSGAGHGCSRWTAAIIRGMLADVLATALPGEFSLRDVPRARRLTELEFTYPVTGLDPDGLHGLLTRHGRRLPKPVFPELTGYLRGFIDLVFARRGKWYVLDWKSNHLGARPEDYDRARLAEEMFRHAYELQALIYLTALHRYLRRRLPGYDYDVHMGGTFYLFIRGVRPSWPAAGIWYDRPEREGKPGFSALSAPGARHPGLPGCVVRLRENYRFDAASPIGKMAALVVGGDAGRLAAWLRELDDEALKGTRWETNHRQGSSPP